MKIDNKYKLKDYAYVGETKMLIYRISIGIHNDIEYQLWDSKTNNYTRYDEFMVSDKKDNIGFKEKK